MRHPLFSVLHYHPTHLLLPYSFPYPPSSILDLPLSSYSPSTPLLLPPSLHLIASSLSLLEYSQPLLLPLPPLSPSSYTSTSILHPPSFVLLSAFPPTHLIFPYSFLPFPISNHHTPFSKYHSSFSTSSLHFQSLV